MNNTQKINSKHRNQVRIIGGDLRGRKIGFVDADGLRPTPDSVREKLFNWLGQDLTGWVVLDLFSGSGALAFEAVSRHAQQVIMCEANRITAQNLRECAQQLGCVSQVQVVWQDGLLFLQQTQQQFDLIMLDPPFTWQDWDKVFVILRDKLASDGMIYLEAGQLPVIPDWLQIYRQGRAGKSHFLLLTI